MKEKGTKASGQITKESQIKKEGGVVEYTMKLRRSYSKRQAPLAFKSLYLRSIIDISLS